MNEVLSDPSAFLNYMKDGQTLVANASASIPPQGYTAAQVWSIIMPITMDLINGFQVVQQS